MTSVDRVLAVSHFADKFADPAPYDRPWRDIVAGLLKPKARKAKGDLPLIKLARFGDKPNPRGKGSLRWNGNVEWISGVIVEHDAGKMSPEDAAAALRAHDIESFVFTTPSHTDEHPRWRVLAPLAHDHAPGEHGSLVDRLNGVLAGVLANESWTLSQIYYVGRIEGKAYKAIHVEGSPLDLVDGIEPIGKKGKLADTPPRERVEVEPRADLAELRELLQQYDPDSDYPEWLRIGQVIHHSTDGSADGLALFDEWSSGGSKYQGAEEIEAKWESFGHVAVPVTIGSLRREQRASAADFEDVPGVGGDVDLDAVQAEAKRVRIELVPLQSFARRTPVRYLVDGLIEIGELFGFIGQRKGGKSYAALDLAFAVAQGRQWAKHAVLDAGPVVWVAAEGARSLEIRRGPQWMAHYGAADIRVWPHGLNLRKSEVIDGLLEVCRDARLVVIDSLRRVTPGAKENSSDELAEVLAHAEKLTRETGAAVSLIAHAGKGDATVARGSSVIEDQLEAGFSVEKLAGENAGKFRVTPTFARDEETGDDAAMFFELQPITPEGLTPGVIVNWDIAPPARKPSAKREAPDWQAFTDEVIAELAALGEELTRKDVHAAVKPIADERLDAYTKSALERGVNRALDARLNGKSRTLRATEYGKSGGREIATAFTLIPVEGNPDRDERVKEMLRDADEDLI